MDYIFPELESKVETVERGDAKSSAIIMIPLDFVKYFYVIVFGTGV